MKLKIRYENEIQTIELDAKATEEMWVSLSLEGEGLSQKEHEELIQKEWNEQISKQKEEILRLQKANLKLRRELKACNDTMNSAVDKLSEKEGKKNG